MSIEQHVRRLAESFQAAKHYNRKRPHSVLAYRPAAPVSYSRKPYPLDPHQAMQ